MDEALEELEEQGPAEVPEEELGMVDRIESCIGYLGWKSG